MTRRKKYPRGPQARNKVRKTMGEFKRGTLHSGSKRGPRVTSRKQAVAIAMSQARREQKRTRRRGARR
jgi:hypothetical protein